MSNNSMNIHIRWCSEQDIVFSVNINQDTIADIKQKVFISFFSSYTFPPRLLY